MRGTRTRLMTIASGSAVASSAGLTFGAGGTLSWVSTSPASRPLRPPLRPPSAGRSTVSRSVSTAASRVASTAWQAMLDAARIAWPDVRIDPGQVVDFIAQRLAGPDLAAQLATAPGGDLVLAAACAEQEPTAHAAFDAVLAEVDAAGASTRSQ